MPLDIVTSRASIALILNVNMLVIVLNIFFEQFIRTVLPFTCVVGSDSWRQEGARPASQIRGIGFCVCVCVFVSAFLFVCMLVCMYVVMHS